MTLKAYESRKTVTVKDLIGILSELPPEAEVINSQENNIKIYPGRDTKTGKEIVMIG